MPPPYDLETFFSGESLAGVFQKSLKHMRGVVKDIDEEQFTSTTDEELMEQLAPAFYFMPLSFVGEPVLRPLRGGSVLTLQVNRRFAGHHQLWTLKPNQFTLRYPWGRVVGGVADEGEVTFWFDAEPEDATATKSKIEDNFGLMQKWMDYQRPQVEQHNAAVKPALRLALQARRDTIAATDAFIKAIGIEVVPKPGMPNVSVVPLSRKVHFVRPAPVGGTKQEHSHYISDESYEGILSLIRHAGATFEEAPETFSKFEEEELRHVLRAMLNGYYRGAAQGEAFRAQGKTDILIVQENRAAFVAECKVWTGQAAVTEAVSQLNGYTTWRDTKTALVLFNKNVAGFTGIQQKVEPLLQSLSGFLGVLPVKFAGEWRVRLKDPKDQEMTRVVHVFLFNLFAPR